MVACLGGLAGIASRQGKGRMSALLFGAVDAALQEYAGDEARRTWLQPADQAQYDAIKAEAEGRVERGGRELWEKHLRAGRKLGLEEAIKIALEESPMPPRGVGNDLTSRQLEVLRLRAEGMETPEITATLSIAKNTLDRHESAILRKLGVGSMRRAISQARKDGLLD